MMRGLVVILEIAGCPAGGVPLVELQGPIQPVSVLQTSLIEQFFESGYAFPQGSFSSIN